jgi:dTDP-4-amino-4,6-dideoxygalactose transaminase
MRPIGGALGLDLSAVLSRLPTPAPLPGPSVASGRTALRLIARTLKGPVLLPSYLCSAVVQPFREERVPYTFYRVDRRLEVDLDDLTRHIRDLRPAAVVVISYFGFPVGRDLADALKPLRPDVCVVEDCAHGSLLEFPEPLVGGVGDIVFTSFRKYLPLPDGGLISGPQADDLPAILPGQGSHVALRLLARGLRGTLPDPAIAEDLFVSLEDAAEADLDAASPLEGASELALRLLALLDLSELAARRRANYGLLAEAFAEDGGLRAAALPLRPVLPERVSPLVFPVVAAQERRDAIRDQLRARHVFTPVHWPLPDDVDLAEFPESAALSRSIIGLPVDQRYGPDEMQSLLGRFRDAARS